MLRRTGIKRQRTTAYHPQSNGLLERAHSTLKNMLRTLVIKIKDWERVLPSALLAMRTAISNIDVSPSLLLYGEQISVPSTFFTNELTYDEKSVSGFMLGIQEDMRKVKEFVIEHDKTLSGTEPPAFPHRFNASYAWLIEPVYKGSLRPKYLGPFKVMKIEYPSNCH